ncbi:GNAT family N-acetyltransferase [Homoserinimonas aerilata]|uniref:GNAT family N-acetyltransferase n=1 Tax=Homoserinimonas aerilata TaxID=1162970 RepID=UPI00115401A4|nr:GNAT family N-acetyltransferase [Homoserinimonas aerilata]
MKRRAIRKDHTIIVLSLLLFGAGLIAINVVWPAIFGVAIALAGVVGALMVLYEVRLTKRIAQAEFIRDLQTGFASDPNISEIWRRVLLGEEITHEHRPLVSSFLTFFETLHLLLRRGALELKLVDELFRNRFFLAVGNPGILDTALLKHAASFTNIHRLIHDWHAYWIENGVPVHAGYYSYIRALTEAKGYEVVRLQTEDLPALLELQQQVLDGLGTKPWLRRNSEEMLAECLTGQVSLGARRDGRLVAAAILYDGGTSEENIRKYFTDDEDELGRAINLKLVLVAPGEVRSGLGRTLVELLEAEAAALGKREILCTIHPKNSPSLSLFGKLGHLRLRTVNTAYGRRHVFGRTLAAPNQHWFR